MAPAVGEDGYLDMEAFPDDDAGVAVGDVVFAGPPQLSDADWLSAVADALSAPPGPLVDGADEEADSAAGPAVDPPAPGAAGEPPGDDIPGPDPAAWDPGPAAGHERAPDDASHEDPGGIGP